MNIVMQIHLYQWIMSEHGRPEINTGELMQEMLFPDDARLHGKRGLGLLLSRLTPFEPRKLRKNAAGDRKIFYFCFGFKENIQYPLEYLMCSWIPWLREKRPADYRTVDKEYLEKALSELLAMDYDKVESVAFKQKMTNHPYGRWDDSKRFEACDSMPIYPPPPLPRKDHGLPF